MALLTGLTPDGVEVPVQVKPDGKLVAEGLTGPAGAPGPSGPPGGAASISGTAAAPGLAVAGSPASGLFSPGVNRVAISTSGVSRLCITENGPVGLGTDNPMFRLDVIGTMQIGSPDLNSPKYLRINSNIAAGTYGGIQWYNQAWDALPRAAITSGEAGWSGAGYLAFATGGGGVTERLRITWEGKVGIGNTDPRSMLHISGAVSADDGLELRSPDGSWWRLQVSDTGQVTALKV